MPSCPYDAGHSLTHTKPGEFANVAFPYKTKESKIKKLRSCDVIMAQVDVLFGRLGTHAKCAGATLWVRACSGSFIPSVLDDAGSSLTISRTQ